MENYDPQAVVKVVRFISAPQLKRKLSYVTPRMVEISVISVNLFQAPNIFRNFSLVTNSKEPVVRVAVSPISAAPPYTSPNLSRPFAAQNRTKLKQSQGAFQDGMRQDGKYTRMGFAAMSLS